jgi:predicted translin family RNA/ssDNA-binding protein
VFNKTVEKEMKISEAIESLKRELEQYGDVEVEYYYDDNTYNVYCSVGYIMYESDRKTVVFM